jgi:hypothetical protein
MSEPVFHVSYRDFAKAVGLHVRTVKTYAAKGRIRTVKLGPRLVRLEEPSAWQAREGEWHGPQEPTPAAPDAQEQPTA